VTSFAFNTTWGANRLEAGNMRFRLWAPTQERLSLVAPDTGVEIGMSRGGDGWFDAVTDAITVNGGYVFRLQDGFTVPDPAARAQIDDVHGPSRLVDPRAFNWRTADWNGRAWEEAVIYELHTGTFSADANFDGVRARLDHIERLGITAIELMPVAQFAGRRGWGYDGVLLYAPHRSYGGPEGLKRLIDAAHERKLMVLLDVVYNHFGPAGNYLHLYAPDFFDPARTTPWGAAIAYGKKPVRDFFIDNALYWIEEFRLDGLRLDAIDHIDQVDQSVQPLLDELAHAVRQRISHRHVHLITEDDRNIVRLHERDAGGRPRLFTAEWNDDFHHSVHVQVTGETDGYYADYAEDSVGKLARALAEGYVYQGEPSLFRNGAQRGVASASLPPTAFINFVQNHDQIGNRAFGERLTTLTNPQRVNLVTTLLLLSPHIPLLFMGEEWGETRPFFFFTDFGGRLGASVRDGRCNEFRKWASFQDGANRRRIPDPESEATFRASMLDWEKSNANDRQPRLGLIKHLLSLRARDIAPHLAGMSCHATRKQVFEDAGLCVEWRLGDGARLAVVANLTDRILTTKNSALLVQVLGSDYRRLFETEPNLDDRLLNGELAPWSAVFRLAAPSSDRQ
jgi:maltooligosyltrehalose trehalohydrolase